MNQLLRMTHLNRRALLGLVILGIVVSGTAQADLAVIPDAIRFELPFEQAQLLVTAGTVADSRNAEDLTTQCTFQSSNPAVAVVDSLGRIRGLSDGDATIQVTFQGQNRSIPVHVEGANSNSPVRFVEQIEPVLFRAGCNAGACHASQYGKGGFTLSVIGFDPAMDHDSMVHEGRGRRVSLTNPSASLILQKPTMTLPHGGGRRIEPDSPDYRLLKTWIEQGAKAAPTTERKLESLSVQPSLRTGTVGMKQQVRVIAKYTDGKSRDVTAWARFDTMDSSMASVTAEGLVNVIGKGQGQIMARFGGEAAVLTLVIPFAESVDLTTWKNHNFVDELAAIKFQELRISPSPLCDDATFLRRVFLDITGSAPTIEESIAFLDSTEADKRTKLVDRLLGLTGDPSLDIYNDRYAAIWSLKWADLIRNSSTVLGDSGMWALHNWLRESFRVNKPFDRFVRELVTAKGSIYSNGPANYYRIANNPSDLAEATSQLFLGTRLMCAKCHHHPYEKYGQDEYYSFAAFFSRVSTKNSSEFGVFGQETVVLVRSAGEVGHPKTGRIMKPTTLDGVEADDPLDRRVALANWLTSTQNEMFARNVVNRYVSYLLGRGLVEPVDDMRSTNPATNEALMKKLADDFRASGFNVKHLIRTIVTSRLYQLDSQPTPLNASDTKFYSHFEVKRLAAEPLLDCIDYATGSPTKHPNLPLGTRATELPDANYPSPFLKTFGKPLRKTTMECERSPDENLAQALHTLNGDIVVNKIADGNGRIAKALAAKKPNPELLTELYLATLSRRPTEAELALGEEILAKSPSPTEGFQDLLWALINSKQFIFNR